MHVHCVCRSKCMVYTLIVTVTVTLEIHLWHILFDAVISLSITLNRLK